MATGPLNRLRNRIEARRAGSAPIATGFRRPPEARGTGTFAAGRALIAAGSSPAWATPEAQGFLWLDDLAAVGDEDAGRLAARWTSEWIALYGTGAGWTPELTGRRVLRWLDHSAFVAPRQTDPATLAALSRQIAFLDARWSAAPQGMPRIGALAALIAGSLTLKGLSNRVGAEVMALSQECAALVDAGGAIPSRNPEELLDLLILILTVDAATEKAGLATPLSAIISHIVGVLRSLRHTDGSLARFHGGGAGVEGRLDLALAEARVKTRGSDPAMGFSRLSAGRSTVIVDAAAPPDTVSAHASTLSLELTSGRRPLIVSCGSGTTFGTDWAKASRATASHSTLGIEGYSSSRLGRGDVLKERAQVHGFARQTIREGTHLQASHDGWSKSHGLTHTRDLLLSSDGRRLVGEDALAAITPAERRRFARQRGTRFALRFHLHPDVGAVLHSAADAVRLTLRSGEVWEFTYEGPAALALEPSSYLDVGQNAPRRTQQIVLIGMLAETQTQIGWTLAKAQDTPLAIRDLDRDDSPAV